MGLCNLSIDVIFRCNYVHGHYEVNLDHPCFNTNHPIVYHRLRHHANLLDILVRGLHLLFNRQAYGRFWFSTPGLDCQRLGIVWNLVWLFDFDRLHPLPQIHITTNNHRIFPVLDFNWAVPGLLSQYR